MRRFRVEDDGRRTLTVHVREALDLSHRRARALVQSGRVRVDGRVVQDPAHRPEAGAEVEIGERAPAPAPAISGPGFRVVHLDRELVAVDKQPGVVVVPTSDPDPDDPPLVARVIAALGLAGHRGEALWVVHRIDRETSGLVLFARSEGAWQRLRRAFRDRRPLREYLAITEAVPETREGELVHFLVEDPVTHRVRVSPGPCPEGREARLRFQVLAERRSRPARALVRFRLVTGRRNQIRAQAAAAGWPLVGDRWYDAADRGSGRTALHAARLELPAGMTASRKRLVLTAPLPGDLAALCRRWFGADQVARP